MSDDRAREFLEDFIQIAKKHKVGLEIYIEDVQGYDIAVWDDEDGTDIDKFEIHEFEGRLRIMRPYHRDSK